MIREIKNAVEAAKEAVKAKTKSYVPYPPWRELSEADKILRGKARNLRRRVRRARALRKGPATKPTAKEAIRMRKLTSKIAREPGKERRRRLTAELASIRERVACKRRS